MEKEINIKLTDGTEPGEADEVLRINLAPYKKKQAGRLLGIKFEKELKAMGAVRSTVDPCLYTWSHPVHGLVRSYSTWKISSLRARASTGFRRSRTRCRRRSMCATRKRLITSSASR